MRSDDELSVLKRQPRRAHQLGHRTPPFVFCEMDTSQSPALSTSATSSDSSAKAQSRTIWNVVDLAAARLPMVSPDAGPAMIAPRHKKDVHLVPDRCQALGKRRHRRSDAAGPPEAKQIGRHERDASARGAECAAVEHGIGTFGLTERRRDTV